jgi:AcrR family transcriptional regulator
MAKIKAIGTGTKKETIIKEAAVLFRVKGYRASSMRELALKLGVEAPSLYNHIGGKSELLQLICKKVDNDFTEHLNEVAESENPVAKKLELLIRFHINQMLQSFNEVYVANHEWKHLEEPFLNRFLLDRRNYKNRMELLVAEGIEKKELADIHPQVAVLLILSAVRGVEFWHRQKRDISPAALENNMVKHLLTGLNK